MYSYFNVNICLLFLKIDLVFSYSVVISILDVLAVAVSTLSRYDRSQKLIIKAEIRGKIKYFAIFDFPTEFD